MEKKPLLAVAAVALLSLYLVLCCGSLLETDASGNLLAHSYSVWGDWSAHFTFIQNLRERGLHWITGDSPVFAGAPFQYPFLSHLLTAFLGGLFGISTIAITEWLSLLLLFVAPFAVYRLYRQFGLKSLSGFVSVAVLFLVGGFQWMGFLSPNELSSKDPLTNHFDNASVFTQFVLFEFYPQRAFLFGLLILSGVGFALLRARAGKRLTRRAAVGSAIALSLLSLTHVHSYLALASFLLFYFAFHRERRVFLFSLSVAVGGCAGLAFLLLRNRHPEYQLSWELWQPGWAMNEKVNLKPAAEMNPVSFWLLNTGLYLPLAWAGYAFTEKYRESYPLARVWFGAGMFLFVLANLFNLQPYWYDNLKTFTYAFFFFAPLIGVFFERVLLTRKWLYPVAAVVLVAQTYSGVHDLEFQREHNQTALFFSAQEFTLAEEFKRLRNAPDDLVVISPRHNHWLPCLTGSPVLMGFAGWLWSWGINYGGREAEVNAILSGSPQARELLAKYDVSYVVLQANDRVGNQPVNLEFFRSQFSRILNHDGWEVFAVKSPSSSVR